MIKEDRKKRIMELLQQSGSVTVASLCDHLNVTEMTIRRDLEQLQSAGMLNRVHGGAVLSNKEWMIEQPVMIRNTVNIEKKLAVAQAAANMIVSGQKLLIGSGSTTQLITRFMDSRLRIIVITESLIIATELVAKENITTILAGGEVRAQTFSTTGTVSEHLIGSFRYHAAFLGATGIGYDGTLYTSAVDSVGMYRAAIENSKQLFIVADSTKIGKDDFVVVGKLDRRSTIITNIDAPASFVAKCREFGTQVVLT